MSASISSRAKAALLRIPPSSTVVVGLQRRVMTMVGYHTFSTTSWPGFGIPINDICQTRHSKGYNFHDGVYGGYLWNAKRRNHSYKNVLQQQQARFYHPSIAVGSSKGSSDSTDSSRDEEKNREEIFQVYLTKRGTSERYKFLQDLIDNSHAKLDYELFVRMMRNIFSSGQNLYQADAYLKGMVKLLQLGRIDGSEVNVHIFDMVLRLWTKRNRPDAVERSEEILKDIEDLYDQKLIFFSANQAQYELVLDMYQSLGQNERFKVLSERMVEKNPKSDLKSKLYFCAKSSRNDAGERAEQLLDQLIGECISGENGDFIDEWIFNIVIEAYATSCQPKKAESVLEKMNNIYVENATQSALPSIVSFNAVLLAWEIFSKKHKSAEAGERAEQILHHMRALYEQDILEVLPNPRSYAHATRIWNEVRDLQRLESLYVRATDDLKSRGGRIHIESLISWMRLVAELKLPNAGEKADSILVQSQESGYAMTNPALARYALKCWQSNSDHPLSGLRCAQLQEYHH